MTNTPPQTILCIGDGGLQGSFIAGAMAELVEHHEHKVASIQHIFATSASMATLMYYLSFNNKPEGERIWTDIIPNSSFLSFTSLKSLFGKNPVYNIDLLVDTIFRDNNPLNIEAIRATHYHVAFPILNLTTKQVELFSNKPELTQTMFPHHTIRNWLNYDIYDLIRASCAIPILYDKPVQLGEHTYCDAGITAPFLVPHTLTTPTRAIYMVVRPKTLWSHDYKLILASAIWRYRAFRQQTGLPGWVYTRIMAKPFKLTRLTKQLKRTIPNLVFIHATTPLRSSLQNTPESALHNWNTGRTHTQLHKESLTKLFTNESPSHKK